MKHFPSRYVYNILFTRGTRFIYGFYEIFTAERFHEDLSTSSPVIAFILSIIQSFERKELYTVIS